MKHLLQVSEVQLQLVQIKVISLGSILQLTSSFHTLQTVENSCILLLQQNRQVGFCGIQDRIVHYNWYCDGNSSIDCVLRITIRTKRYQYNHDTEPFYMSLQRFSVKIRLKVLHNEEPPQLFSEYIQQLGKQDQISGTFLNERMTERCCCGNSFSIDGIDKLQLIMASYYIESDRMIKSKRTVIM